MAVNKPFKAILLHLKELVHDNCQVVRNNVKVYSVVQIIFEKEIVVI